jgi:hypothetical protein
MSLIPLVSKNTRTWKIKTLDSGPRWKIVCPIFNKISCSIAYCVRDKVNNDLNCGIYAVFDGHGGKHVADHVAERIPEELRKELIKNPAGDLSPAIEQVFLRVSKIILNKVHRLIMNCAYWTLITLGAQPVSQL